MFMNLYKRCLAKLTKQVSIHSFVSELTRKYHKLHVRRELTRAQKQEIQAYYKQLTGHRVPLIWHKFLYSRTNIYSKQYIPLSLYRTELIGRMNQFWMMEAYADKNISDLLFPDVTQPKIFVKNMNGYFYADGKAITREEAERICGNLEAAIIKPSMSTRGHGVRKIRVQNGITDLNGKTIGEVFTSYGQDFLVQEVVQQHEAMCALNPTSANTIRLLTYRSDMEVILLYAVIRIGQKDQVIDNESSGGISARINLDGTLAKYAYGAPGNDMVEKTDVGVTLEGYAIPSFDQVVATAKRLHYRLPYFNIAAWDFAVGKDGEPIFIEWNANPDLSQTAYGPAFGENTEHIIQETYKKKNSRNEYW